jgi:cytochrome c-type biogenesis protein CcmF
MLVYFVAFTGMAFRKDLEATLKPGDSITLTSPFGHSYQLTHIGVSQYERLNRVVTAASLDVKRDGRPLGIMSSEKRQHVDSFGRPTFEPSTEVAIRSNAQEDLYIVFAGSVQGTEEAVYRFTINPLVMWVWGGGVILVIGGLITMWPGAPAVPGTLRRAQAGYEVRLAGAGTGA